MNHSTAKKGKIAPTAALHAWVDLGNGVLRVVQQSYFTHLQVNMEPEKGIPPKKQKKNEELPLKTIVFRR